MTSRGWQTVAAPIPAKALRTIRVESAVVEGVRDEAEDGLAVGGEACDWSCDKGLETACMVARGLSWSAWFVMVSEYLWGMQKQCSSSSSLSFYEGGAKGCQPSKVTKSGCDLPEVAIGNSGGLQGHRLRKSDSKFDYLVLTTNDAPSVLALEKHLSLSATKGQKCNFSHSRRDSSKIARSAMNVSS